MISLLLILVAAWFFGSLFARFGLPFVLGQLVAGVLIGPPILGIVTPSPGIELLAELGIFFVMFHTGMEMDPKELIEHIRPSLAVAIGGFILPFALGYFVTQAFGGTLYQSLFVGMGISITAIAVQSVILNSLQISSTYIGHIIIGAAIADDILSLVGVSVLLSLARTGSIQPA
jgi:Kef-type K+ transport system membrane component KefB